MAHHAQLIYRVCDLPGFELKRDSAFDLKLSYSAVPSSDGP
jgi:hypothetical protein